MANLENTVAKNVNNINNSIETTNEKSSELIEKLNLVGSEFSKFATKKTSEIEYLSANSTQAITKLAGYTNQLTKELEANLEKLNTTNTKNLSSSTDFLNDAGYIIEKLNSISIDITNLISPEDISELWNKYNSGYKTVFSRYVNHILNKRQLSSIQELFTTNSNFKNYVTNFIREFDNLILKASTTDKREILLSTISTTDIGKAYIILKELKP